MNKIIFMRSGAKLKLYSIDQDEYIWTGVYAHKEYTCND